MSNAEDHALGLELQLIELVEQQERARIQHRDADAAAVQTEIDALQEELARTGEVRDAGSAHIHDADPAAWPAGSAA
ncbi:MAG TPA: hypothetical protein VMU63_10115 [Acidimicrobiales bacterium]|nr:hypothetical protein [Acidimicrobiales bacterium]